MRNNYNQDVGRYESEEVWRSLQEPKRLRWYPTAIMRKSNIESSKMLKKTIEPQLEFSSFDCNVEEVGAF